MDSNQKIFVSIYCKIFNDSFSDALVDRLATGTEIYDFLLEDACHCFDEDGSIIPGDCNLWYLGACEKFGWLVVENDIWTWSFGESSFNNVEGFVIDIYKMGVITKQQYQTLLEKIAEGRLIDNMYDIGAYLICIRDGFEWNKKADAGNFRQDIKRMTWNVGRSFRENGYQFYSGGTKENYEKKGDTDAI